jgi:hypothetical protein
MSEKSNEQEDMNKIPPFSNGDWAVNCKTVGEVVRELQRLPADLPVEQGFSKGVDLVVFNRMHADVHLEFEESGDWTNDDLED